MSIDRFQERLDQIRARVPFTLGKGEAATKQALILPMLEILGYDIWNPGEVHPEFEGDFAIKKAGQKEKVDLAILLGGQPRIFIEAKPADCGLDGHEGQLARYFNAVPSVTLGVMTDGMEYRFYTDTSQPNLMDARPFFTFRLDSVDPRLDVLARFHKESFNADALRDFATELFFTAKITNLLRSELDLRGKAPSEGLIRWILGQEGIFDGRVNGNVVERFRPIVGSAMGTVLREIVRRSVAALDHGVTEPAPAAAAPVTPAAVAPAAVPAAPAADDADASKKAKIHTSEAELKAFEIVRSMLEGVGLTAETIYDPSQRKEVPIEVGYADTTAYFGVYLNKPGWWLARLWIDARQPWIGFPLPADRLRAIVGPDVEVIEGHAHASSGLRLQGPDDLRALAGPLEAAARWVMEARRA